MLRTPAPGLILKVLLWIALSTLLSSAHAAVVTRGPYLMMATPDSMVIRWRTDVATNSRVQSAPRRAISPASRTMPPRPPNTKSG